jgi:hypothetical protein
MRDALFALVKNPTAVTYGELLRQVIAQPGFQIYTDDMRLLRQKFEAGDFTGVRDGIAAVMRFWIHSPEIHLMAWSVAKRLGDAETEKLEVVITEACLVGMQASGDGSLARPYQVAHVDDEYALLRFTRIQCTREGSIASNDGRTIDVFRCPDGRALHFQLPGVGGLFARSDAPAGPSQRELQTVRVRPPPRGRGGAAPWRRPLIIAAIALGAALTGLLIRG